MLKNLRIEWMKIKNYRVFQVFSVLYIIGILAIIYIFYRVYINLISSVTGGRARDLFDLFGPENIWRTVCFFTSFLLYLPGMVIINLFSNEVNFKTHRQNIIDGWKRETFIYSKIALIICISIVITITNLLAVLVMCQVTNSTFSFQGAETLIFCFLQSFIYLMFALTLATLFRRSGVAIIIFFIYGLILEFLLIWLFNNIYPGLGNYMPLQVADSLIPLAGMRDSWLYNNLPSEIVVTLVALAFAGLYIFLAVRKYKRDDL